MIGMTATCHSGWIYEVCDFQVTKFCLQISPTCRPTFSLLFSHKLIPYSLSSIWHVRNRNVTLRDMSTRLAIWVARQQPPNITGSFHVQVVERQSAVWYKTVQRERKQWPQVKWAEIIKSNHSEKALLNWLLCEIWTTGAGAQWDTVCDFLNKTSSNIKLPKKKLWQFRPKVQRFNQRPTCPHVRTKNLREKIYQKVERTSKRPPEIRRSCRSSCNCIRSRRDLVRWASKVLWSLFFGWVTNGWLDGVWPTDWRQVIQTADRFRLSGCVCVKMWFKR